MKQILIIGGDARYVALANLLSSDYDVSIVQLNHPDLCEKIRRIPSTEKYSPDALILPMPFSKNDDFIYAPFHNSPMPLSDVYNLVCKNMPVFGGHFTRTQIRGFQMRYARLFDFTKDTKLSWFNAIATAEGAIAEAIRYSKINLHKKNCLVLGFGKCGRTLSGKLKAFDCDVTVACRRSEISAQAYTQGFHTIDIANIRSSLVNYSFIFNTIPAIVLREPELSLLAKEVTLIDIASAPGGMDYTYVKEHSINGYLCPGLPGVYAPNESAQYLYHTILENIEI